MNKEKNCVRLVGFVLYLAQLSDHNEGANQMKKHLS
jgi:hypothetical protein